MPDQLTLRATRPSDLPALDALFAASYPVLLKPDYPPSVLVTALPLISRAQPALVRSGTFYLVEDGEGRALAAGGWTHTAPQGGVGPRDLGHIRHVVTHPDAVRKGLAGAIMTRCFETARKAGISWMICQSTRTAVPFYKAMGFEARAEIEVMLRPGIGFPAVEMACVL